LETQVTASKLLEIVRTHPWERIYAACGQHEASLNLAEKMADAYMAFLEITDRSKGEPGLLQDDGEWTRIKEQSEIFASALVELIELIGPDDALQLVAL
jgi:hypothetical protein